MKKNPKLHLGHFQRVRNRILNEDINNFDDILAVEMMLQSPMQRGDTNEIAKEILSVFGSFHKFCRLAKYDDLIQINGIGAVVAEKLMCFVKLFRYAKFQSCDSTEIDVSDIQEFYSFLKKIYEDYDHEVLMLFVLNKHNEVCHFTILQHGDTSHVSVDLGKITEITRIHKGTSVIMVHNHPVGPFYPSVEDFQTTQQAMAYCHSRGIKFIDHIIVNQKGYFSFRYSRLLSAMQSRLTQKLRERRMIYG